MTAANQQIIVFFIDSLLHDYMKIKVMRENLTTLQRATTMANEEQNLRRHLNLRSSNPLSCLLSVSRRAHGGQSHKTCILLLFENNTLTRSTNHSLDTTVKKLNWLTSEQENIISYVKRKIKIIYSRQVNNIKKYE